MINIFELIPTYAELIHIYCFVISLLGALFRFSFEWIYCQYLRSYEWMIGEASSLAVLRASNCYHAFQGSNIANSVLKSVEIQSTVPISNSITMWIVAQKCGVGMMNDLVHEVRKLFWYLIHLWDPICFSFPVIWHQQFGMQPNGFPFNSTGSQKLCLTNRLNCKKEGNSLSQQCFKYIHCDFFSFLFA